MRISDWSSDVCSSDLNCCGAAGTYFVSQPDMADRLLEHKLDALAAAKPDYLVSSNIGCTLHIAAGLRRRGLTVPVLHPLRSEEHTSELQSLMRISYAVFCLKKKTQNH